MKTKSLIFSVLVVGSVLARFQPAIARDIFQWVDARGVIHFTDDYSRIPLSVRKMPDQITRHVFAESEEEASPVKASTSAEKTDHSQLPKDPVPTPREAAANSASEDPNSNENVTVIVVNNSLHNKPCRGHDCSGRFQPSFNDRRYIHPDVFTGGARQYIQPEAFPQRRSSALQSNPNVFKNREVRR